MSYKVALSPDLGLNAEEFVQAWNETPETQAVATARVAEGEQVDYDPALIAGGLAVLGSVAVGLATNALYDLIKAALRKRGVQKQAEVVEIEQADGTRLLVVFLSEE